MDGAILILAVSKNLLEGAHYALALVALATIGMLVMTAVNILVPCRCGKISQINAERQRKLLDIAFAKRDRSNYSATRKMAVIFYFALIASVAMTPFYSHCNLSHIIGFMRCFLAGGSLIIFAITLTLILNIESKSGRREMQASLLLSDAEFGPQALRAKTQDELSYLSTCAMNQGDWEHADMISKYLLHQAENSVGIEP
jgi:hypothetical protein